MITNRDIVSLFLKIPVTNQIKVMEDFGYTYDRERLLQDQRREFCKNLNATGRVDEFLAYLLAVHGHRLGT